MIAIRRSTVNNLTPFQRRIVKLVLDRIELGDPAVMTDGTNPWFVWDDPRISLDDVAILGCVAANLNRIPNDYDPDTKQRREMRADIVQFLAARLKPPVPDADDPWAATLQANGAPAAIRAGNLPETWRPADAG